MAAGNTYTPIATTTTSGDSSVTFSSIPSTYTDLVLSVSGTRSSGGDAIKVRLNGDTTASNYSNTALGGDGSTAYSNRQGTLYGYFDNVGLFDQSRALLNMNFNSYSNNTTYKTMLVRSNTSDFWTLTYVGLYKNTSAINSIQVFMNGMASGTTMTLYGIAAA